MNPLVIALLAAALVSLVLVILLIAERDRFSETDHLPEKKNEEKNADQEKEKDDKFIDFSGGLFGI